MRTGLRSVELRQDADQWGRSFEFVVNGIPIFAKGADVVPLDKFPNATTVERTRAILQSVKDANMNMIRIWGGGYYETQEFYEICDELGIMVWQDFMFYNPWQPGNYPFKQDIAAEVTDQLKRLRNHPSMVLWCGNNEEENNFLQDSVNVTPMARLQMWTDYLTVFSGIIPTLVARYDPATPYWPSSPSGDYAETKDKNYWVLEDGDDVGGNEEFGDTHDYTIGTSMMIMPRLPFSSEEDRHYRFVSEYGFESFPDMQTIERSSCLRTGPARPPRSWPTSRKAQMNTAPFTTTCCNIMGCPRTLRLSCTAARYCRRNLPNWSPSISAETARARWGPSFGT